MEEPDRTFQCGWSTSSPLSNVKEAFSRAGRVRMERMGDDNGSFKNDERRCGSTKAGTSCCSWGLTEI